MKILNDIKVRNVMYLLPQMEEEIEEKFHEFFFHQPIELILINFLFDIHSSNVYFDQLHHSEILSDLDYFGDILFNKNNENNK